MVWLGRFRGGVAMGTSGEACGDRGRPAGGRLRTIDLMFGVMAVGCAAGLVAPSGRVWARFSDWGDPILGVFATAISVVLAMILARSVCGHVAEKDRQRRGAWIWAIAWRGAAVAGLVALFMEEAWWLRHGIGPEDSAWHASISRPLPGGTIALG